MNLMGGAAGKEHLPPGQGHLPGVDPHLQILYHKAYELETICPTVLTEQAVFRALSK